MEDWPRTLVLRKIPPFAIEEDIRELFEESGFPM
jgi:RNA recognition motif-containing protein